MRLIHTSDWHLGITLRDYSRAAEHAAFLTWLVGVIVDRLIDVVIVAGDVFDVANPSIEAQRQWYGFLAEVLHRSPKTQVVVVGGNHDSAGRLEAPDALLSALNTRTVGGVGADTDLERLCLPLLDREGCVRAWVGAVPFLGAASPERVQEVYAAVKVALANRSEPGQAKLLTGHLYAMPVKGEPKASRDSERELVGGMRGVQAEGLAEGVDYVALGHLHLAQQVASNVWYSGSPIPMSFAERAYEHQVLELTLPHEGAITVTPIRVPRHVPVEVWPEAGALTWEDARAKVLAVAEGPSDGAPLVLVRVADLLPAGRRELHELGHSRRLRLCIEGVGRDAAGVPVVPRDLTELHPEDVFRELWARLQPQDPLDDEVLSCFREVLGNVEGQR